MIQNKMKIERFVHSFIGVPLTMLLFWTWVLLNKLAEATKAGYLKVKTWWDNRKKQAVQS